MLFSRLEGTRRKALKQCLKLLKEGTFFSLSIVFLRCFLFLLKWDPSILIRNHILIEILPAMGAFRDSFLTAPILRISKSLLNQNRSSSLEGFSLRMLCGLVASEPRVWVHFRELANLSLSKLESPTRVDKTKDLEITLFSSLRDLCKSKTLEFGEDILPLAIRA
ncbi:hypothetical protein BC829DRAFT_108284 [Chytridium lagenaria]|nr:hypothetical protein BC829DRAFT_108284 [Chytridium lagenaria]